MFVPSSSSSKAKLTVPTVTVLNVRPDSFATDDADVIDVVLRISLDESEKLPTAWLVCGAARRSTTAK
jgi:hypothetical protein